jgi:hypothetical protein
LPKGFSIQRVATAPAGWLVRTVKAGGHRVRVAFPPGRRAKGSGITVEVLHPRNENPLCIKNPAELLLMGGNPIGKKAARERATRIRAARLSNPYDRLSTQEKLAFGRLGLGKAQLRTSADIRRARRKVAEVGRFRNAFPNPGTGLADVNSPEATEARERSEAFHHREWRDYEVRNEPHTPAGEYSLLGQFISISVKPTEKSTDSVRQVREIFFPNGKTVRAMGNDGRMVDTDGSDVQVISAAAGRPIYLVDDQEMDEEELQLFGAGPEDPTLIGEARAISYIDEKWHPEAGQARGVKAMYQHEFGDAGGTKPKVFYSRRMKRLLLEGGSYHVEALGITN